MNDPLLVRALKNEPLERAPVWLMRQAGRYLEEYRALKAKYSFLELCKNPELAAEVTMQPIRFLQPDAAIIFADIMLPAEAMGFSIDFQPGPKVFNPVRSAGDIRALTLEDPAVKSSYVMDALRLVRRELEQEAGTGERKALLGFAGAPWTLACYLIEQGIYKHFQGTQVFFAREPQAALEFLGKITEITEAYLLAQLESGADAVQLFDSWAGNLGIDDYRRFSLPFTVRIIETIHRAGGKIILYLGGSSHLLAAAAESGADCLSVDWRTDLTIAFESVPKTMALQGNLDPCHLYQSAAEVVQDTESMLRRVPEQRRYIANLGHGILPETPRENAKAFVDTVKRGWPK